MPYRVVLIGAGIISRNHLNAIRQMNELSAAAVADIDEERGRTVSGEYGIAYYSDYKEMIRKEKPDIAIIALPHFLHEECAIWCAAQGCHLLLEKPMALNVKQCDAILGAARASGVKLMVGHTQHYWPANLLAKAFIESGELGKLLAIQDTRHLYYFSEHRPAWFLDKDKAGGGILMNLGAHSIDKIQWLTGSRIKTVKAALSYEGARGNVEGSGCIFLETSNGVSAVIVQSGYAGVARDETELIFTQGMIRLVSAKGLWVSRDGRYEEVKPPCSTDPFVLQFEDLLQAIRQDAEPGSTGEYARSVIAALEAVYRSDETGVEQTLDTE
ncbi:Gfo/Idh/MocA family protein [Paenibacillus woosongensis]|uniref:Gfo/Idh/MocA family oxidoreductase n=1 Tax=Paenibacillus woosongensis TaxID=307580 RepID=A0A7X2Z2P1_9BACL|nr:Gfo/Idh/MocA family oxidoreductase [Paenibacillus woosongensis]MUG45694.1 gfo/Idh/MocA family oxidoreductase [Paenibacillus woosongensis]